MRIGLISQWYDPEGGSAAWPGIIARTLVSRGHEVHVLTGFPNYPSGRLASGYRIRPYMREVLRGVTVHRAPLFPNHSSNPAGRIANYLSYAAGSSGIGLTKFPRVDVALVHSTPATAAIPAMAMRWLRRTPFVVQIQDLWPDTVTSSGFLSSRSGRIAEQALHRFCDSVYGNASAVAVTSPSMIDAVAHRGISRAKIHYVPNWTDENIFRPQPRDERMASEWGLDRRFTIMYAGNFGEYQGLDTFIEAARILSHRDDIGFALVGDGVERAALAAQAARHQLSSVRFIPAQAFESMGYVLAMGDAQLISLVDLPLFHSTLPSKIQATLAAGRPIVGALVGDAARVIEKSGAGRVVAPGSAQSLSDAIGTMADMSTREIDLLGKAGFEFYRSEFSQATVTARLETLLDAAANQGVSHE